VYKFTTRIKIVPRVRHKMCQGENESIAMISTFKSYKLRRKWKV